MVTTRPPKTIVKPTALGPVANTDTKLLIYGLFQKGRVLAQDGVADGAGWSYPVSVKGGPAFGGNPQTENSVEIQEVSSFAHFLTFLTRTQVLRKGCFTPSRVSTMMPISFHPLPLQ